MSAEIVHRLPLARPRVRRLALDRTMATMDIGGSDAAYGGGFGPGDTVVAAGNTYDGATDRFAVARWTNAGPPDLSFGSGGFTTTAIGADSTGLAGTVGPDNKIVAAGMSDGNFAVARYIDK